MTHQSFPKQLEEYLRNRSRRIRAAREGDNTPAQTSERPYTSTDPTEEEEAALMSIPEGSDAATLPAGMSLPTEPSAPVQQSEGELADQWKDLVNQYIQAGKILSKPFTEGRRGGSTDLQNNQADAKKKQDLTNAQRRFIDDVQAVMYKNTKAVADLFEPLDQEKDLSNIQIHRLDDVGVQNGSYINLLTHGLPPKPGKTSPYSAFVHATPAQLASLMPLLRFFLVDQDGNEDEIYFSDYTTGEYEKKIANLRSQGSLESLLSPREQRGSSSGIRSFRWNYNNKHEGDYIIEAELELYFGTLAELANVNYLQFLYPTGEIKSVANNINEVANKLSDSGLSPLQAKIKKTDERIKKYSKVLEKVAEDKERIPEIEDKEIRASREKKFRQLKVIVGWSVPEGNEDQLLDIFPDQQSLDDFRESLKTTKKAIFLNLADYDVEFSQEGPTTMSLKYIGSTDNYLARSSSDIFGSSNFLDTKNDFLYKKTYVSVDNIVQIDGKLSAVENLSSEQIKSSKSLSSNPATGIKDEYIESVTSLETKISGRRVVKNEDTGENTIGVTLAGLRAAQELQSLRLQMLDMQQEDENSPEYENIRILGQFYTILYERAEIIRLQDIYSKYIREMLDLGFINRAVISNSTGSLKLKLLQKPLSQESRAKFVPGRTPQIVEIGTQKKLPLVGSEEELNIDPRTETVVYYARFGDILETAIKSSGLRDDISLILGNSNRIGDSLSIYDIPVTIDNFGQFFFNRVVARKVKSYPFRYFMNDMLKVLARIVNNDHKIGDRAAYDYTVISGAETALGELPFNLSKTNLLKIANSQQDPLTYAGISFKHFYPIFETSTSLRGRVGNRSDDESEGIYHYVIGTDRGLAKTFNFSRQDTRYFQEMLIESNNLDDKIKALFLPQNVNITLFGNTLHKNGDLIFVDSRPSLGSFAGPVLGIGGYYRVVRSTHEITNRGYETNLECVFELRVKPGKRKA